MRVRRALAANASEDTILAAQTFSEWLLQLGNGTIPHDENDVIRLPPHLCMDKDADIDTLIDWVFPNMSEHYNTADSGKWFAERAIITPLNTRVDYINNIISNRFPGDQEWECRSADQMVNERDAHLVSIDYLNNMNPSGFAKHVLHLKPYMPIMLIRNLSNGLCNGTRLMVQEVSHL